MDKSDIVVTYETIFEVLMREKGREDLQKLSPAFFRDVVLYLNEKKSVLKSERLDLFSTDEKDRTKRQIANVQRMLTELYERRERKLLNLALIRSRTPGAIIDLSPLLDEEKHLFESMVDTLDAFRKNVCQNLVQAELPVLPMFSQRMPDIPLPQERDTKLIRFISPVPKFVGKELEIYGPFDEEDVASLPFEIADVLIKKGKAEEVME